MKFLGILLVIFSIGALDALDPYGATSPTSKELAMSKKLRESLMDRNGKSFDSDGKYISNYVEDATDEYLANWIRYTEGDMEKAKEKLGNSLKWRNKNDLDNMDDNWRPGKFQGDDFFKHFNYKVSGYTKDGFPVLYLPFGRFDCRQAIADGKRNDVIKIIIKSFEHAMSLTNPKTGKKTSRFYFLVDMDKFTLGQMASVRVVGTMAAALGVYESNYPYHPQTTLIVNAPAYFLPFMNIMKNVMTAETFQYVNVFSPAEKDKWQKEAARFVDKDQMPYELGGTSRKEIPWGQ